MSHFVHIATRFADRQALLEALWDAGHRDIATHEPVRGWMGQTRTADIVVRLSGSYDFGFVWNPATDAFDAVADWSMLRDGQEKHLAPLRQKYAERVALKSAKQAGFHAAPERTLLPDGTIILTLRS